MIRDAIWKRLEMELKVQMFAFLQRDAVTSKNLIYRCFECEVLFRLLQRHIQQDPSMFFYINLNGEANTSLSTAYQDSHFPIDF